MTGREEVRERLDRFWLEADREAEGRKDSQYALDRLTAALKDLKGQEREIAETLVSEWVLSGEPRRQFDALAVIERLLLTSAAPALRDLADQLTRSNEPGAPYDLAWVNRILAKLGATSER